MSDQQEKKKDDAKDDEKLSEEEIRRGDNLADGEVEEQEHLPSEK